MTTVGGGEREPSATIPDLLARTAERLGDHLAVVDG